jgi:hypothetical protein
MSEPILSSSDLADLRQLSDASLPHLARVLTPVLTRGPGGVTSYVYPDVASVPAVSCRVQQATADTLARLNAQQFEQQPISVVAFAVDDVSEQQLTIRTKLVIDGETHGSTWTKQLDVIGVEPTRSYQTQRRALCVPSAVTATL